MKTVLTGILLAGMATLAGAATTPSTASPSPLTTAPAAAQRLPNQWSLQPVGQSIPLGEFPLALVPSPDRRWGAVVQCGVGPHEVRIVDLAHRQEVSSTPLANAWAAAAWSPDSTRLYVSRGADDALARFDIRDGVLSNETTISLTIPGDRPPVTTPPDAETTTVPSRSLPRFPSSLALSPDGRTLFITEMYANRLLKLDLLAPASEGGSAPRTQHPAPAVLCTFEGSRAYPHRIVLHPTRPVAYVALWGASAVAEVNLRTGAVERIATDPHPGAMVLTRDGSRLFVACANSNHVNEIDTKWRMVTALGDTALYPNAPPGSTPSAVALSDNGTFLAVANADNNNVAVFDVRHPGEPNPLGYIPAGEYPTAVTFTPDFDLVILNARGGALPPPPRHTGPDLQGSLQFVPRLDAPTLWQYSQLTYRTSPLKGDFSPVTGELAPTTSPIPRSKDGDSPIYYVVYIIKGSRTYDEVLGDLPGGNGDASLCSFGEAVTPNHHALARDFVLLDNFYAEGQSPAEGRERSTGAYASDYVQRLWPSLAGGHGALPWPAGGHDPVGAPPPSGKIWDRAFEAGVNYRNWGAWTLGGGPACDGRPLDQTLEAGHIDPCYPGVETGLSDAVRAEQFLKELHRYNTEAVLPRLTVIHLPGPSGEKGAPSVEAMAEHDRALGTILDGLSRSRFWKAMAVFVVEESAAGPDHVHPQRSVALLGGPFVKRGQKISTPYSTSSVLRTIGLILGLDPVSQFDAAARPLYDCFTDKADQTPYRKR